MIIKAVWEQDDSPIVCSICKQPSESGWVLFIQIGDTDKLDLNPLGVRLCEKCYTETILNDKK